MFYLFWVYQLIGTFARLILTNE